MSSLSLPSPALSTPAWRIAVVGCAFSLIWSSAFIAGKQAMTGCGPFTLLSLRFLSAGALLWLLRRWLPGDTHQQAQAPASAWRHALIAGLLTNAVYLGLGYHGLRHVPAGLTAILVSTSPLITAAMAALWLHEPLGARRLLGLLCGLGGVAWIMAGRAGGSAALDDTALLGVGMILAGTLALAVSTLFNRRAAIHDRLKPGGRYLSAEISGDLDSPEFPAMLDDWKQVQALMGATDASLAALPEMLRDVLSVLSAPATEALWKEAGFPVPVPFFQAFMIRGWHADKPQPQGIAIG